MRAVESGPPETARTRLGTSTRSANSNPASLTETGSAPSAADTFLFPLDPLLDAVGGPRIFSCDLSQGIARGVLLAERCQRLAKPQQRVGGLVRCLEVCVDRQEGF